MSSVPARPGPRPSRRELVRLGVYVASGLLAGALALAALLPTWLDVRNMFTYALGRTGRQVNEEAFWAPLPPPEPGYHGSRRPPRPPRPVGPLPEVPTKPLVTGDPATRRSYEFYMQELKKAHEFEARQRSQDAGSPGRTAASGNDP
jgi:hypothetical protein